MTLNSTGPISLGGTTTGQSIEIELGGNGTTQISLNDTNVRGLAGLASGQIDFNTFYGKSNVSYFYILISPGQAINMCGHVTNTSNGNTTLITSYPVGSNYNHYVYQISLSGTLINSGAVYSSLNDYMMAPIGQGQGPSFSLDSSCNIYGNNLGRDAETGKITSAIGFGYQKKYGGGINVGNGLLGTGNNGTNYYAAFSWYTGCCCGCHFLGVQSFAMSSGNPVSGIVNKNNSQDPTSSTYYGGYMYIGSATSNSVAKMNSSSVFAIWTAPNNDYTNALSANSTYLGVIWRSSSYFSLYNIAAASSSVLPTHIFSYTISDPNVGTWDWSTCAVTIDSSNNVYYWLRSLSNPPSGFLLAKFNSSGTLQWQRFFQTFYYTGGSYQNNSALYPTISVNGSYVNISFLLQNGGYTTFLQYPTDGSKTGTYTFLYQTRIVITTNSATFTNQSAGYFRAQQTPVVSSHNLSTTSTATGSTGSVPGSYQILSL
jgi:hypothetical protein